MANYATDLDSNVYFVITLALVFLSGIAAALVAGVFGIVSQYPILYTQAITTGQGTNSLGTVEIQVLICMV
jgi:hypothetical protein